MNMQSQGKERPGRIPDISLFEPQGAAAGEPQQGLLQQGLPAITSSVPSYGCVEWFRYPQLPQSRRSADAP